VPTELKGAQIKAVVKYDAAPFQVECKEATFTAP
jgi:hypothetical protein